MANKMLRKIKRVQSGTAVITLTFQTTLLRWQQLTRDLVQVTALVPENQRGRLQCSPANLPRDCDSTVGAACTALCIK